ncbi:MAG: AzlD domain-containing protein [Desulfobacter sp.]
MEHTSLVLLILLMAGVTYLTRVLHVFIPIERIPKWFRDHIHLIPVVIISSIISMAAFVHDGQMNLMVSLRYMAAATVTVTVYFLMRSGGAAVIAGLGAYVLIKLYLV